MRRVMLKLSGEALAGADKQGLNFEFVDSVCKQIKKVKSKSLQIAIMAGGGNFIRGKMLANIDKYKADEIGMLSTCMNAIYIQSVLKLNGVKSTIYGTFDINDMVKVFSKDEAVEKLNLGEVIIFAEGTGHPYFTTDTGVVLRTIELNCDELLLAKSIDGVYDKDPAKYNNAKKFNKLTFKDMLEKKLEVIDLSASTLCLDNKLSCRIFSLYEKNSIIKAIKGDNIGTLIKA